MGRPDMHLAACALAFALLAGCGGAVAVADTGDSEPADQSTSSDADAPTTRSAAQAAGDSLGNDDDADDHPVAVHQEDTSHTEEAVDPPNEDPKPAPDEPGTDDGCGSDTDHGGKIINRIPVVIPEAPPPAEFGPIPQEVPPPPLEPPPPPADLPPLVPASPAEPDPVVVATVGASAGLSEGHGPPVLSVPIISAPVYAIPRNILGASLVARGTSEVQAGAALSRSAGESLPSLMRASTNGSLLREPPTSNWGLSVRGQTPDKISTDGPRLVRPGDIAAAALPALAWIVTMTVGGIGLGYRQAAAGQRLRQQGADSFLASES